MFLARLASGRPAGALRSFATAAGRGPRLDGKVAIVTGAGGGIGRASAILFAREGAKVLCADLNESAVATVADEINAEAGAEVARGMRVDVSKAQEVKAMVESCEGAFGGVHVLFNNAGLMHGDDADAVGTEEDIWDLTMNVNVKGVWYGCKYGIPAMRRCKCTHTAVGEGDV